MESWKNHVRAQLLQRDQTEKFPYEGVYTTLSLLAERFETRKLILDEVQSKSLERAGVDVGTNPRLLYLQLRESEHFAEKLSQTVSDLTTVLYLKEAELQHWQSQVSRFRQEALTLAKGSNTMKDTLSECDFTIETQSKELRALRTEQRELRDALAEACREKERLLQRWMEEKRREAERLNKYNDTQERWQRLAHQLQKSLHREMRKHCVPMVTNSWSAATEASPPSAVQSLREAQSTSEASPDCRPAGKERSAVSHERPECV
ncbi:autophagy-related protein 16 [Genypterus blacodes]|uniref:autophagy-related protein 16 n=1 Tax=Genypterus blacodes TaxID=154954 RepID=UPI003F75A934